MLNLLEKWWIWAVAMLVTIAYIMNGASKGKGVEEVEKDERDAMDRTFARLAKAKEVQEAEVRRQADADRARAHASHDAATGERSGSRRIEILKRIRKRRRALDSRGG